MADQLIESYSKLISNAKEIQNKLQNDFMENIPEYRTRLNPIWELIQDYARKNKILISDVFAICEENIDINYQKARCFHIYASSIIQHAILLTNEIYKLLDQSSDMYLYTLTMKTLIEHEEIVIEYNNWIIVKIFRLGGSNRGTLDVYKAIDPIIIDGINYIPANIEIIDILQQKASYKSSADNIEKKLIPLIRSVYDQVISDTPEKPIEPGKTCFDHKKDQLELLKIELIKKYFSTKHNTALLGTNAFNWLKDGESMCTHGDVLQFTGMESPSLILMEVNKFIQSRGFKWKVILDETPLDTLIPKDFRTKRVRYDISIPGELGIKTKRFMDYFNIARFSLVPCILKDHVLVASADLINRTMFIDLWTWTLLYKSNKVDKNLYQIKVKNIYSKILQVYEWFAINNPPIDGFLGMHLDYDAANKRKNLTVRADNLPYLPYQTVIRTGKLKDVPKHNT